MLKVIGAGVGRTGTNSLKLALEQLGFDKCYHMFELLELPHHLDYLEAALAGHPVDWDAMFDGFQAAVDYPIVAFYEQLMDYYPDAKVILTERDPERWYESVRATIYATSRRSALWYALTSIGRFHPAVDRVRRRRFLLDRLVWDGHFEGRFEERDYAIAAFNLWNETVKQRVLPERLLVYNVQQGWQPLCDFLDMPVPDVPFPRSNSRDEFHQQERQAHPLKRLLGL